MRRVLPAAVALVSAAALSLAPPSASASPHFGQAPSTQARLQVARAALTKTPFVFSASGYGSLVRGAAVPAGSSQTGYMVMGCNRLAGKVRNNFVAAVDVPGLGTVSGIRTRLISRKVGQTYSSISTHSIADVTLADTPLGLLKVEGIVTRSEAFHRPSGYGSKNSVTVARIVFDPPGDLPKIKLAIPAPGAPVVVPGLLRINIAKQTTEKTADYGIAKATGLRLRLIPSKTTVILGNTSARIDRAGERGIFNGYGAGVEASLLDGVAEVGRNALQPLSCQGTDGVDVVKSLASADLSPLATTGALAAGVNGIIGKTGFIAKTAGVATDVDLLDGQLHVGIAIAKANIRRARSGKLFRNANGSKVGEISAGGQTYDLDQLGQVEIPGLAKLEGPVVELTRNGLKVIGLRVTALDGSLAVIDLGVAKAQARPSTKQ